MMLKTFERLLTMLILMCFFIPLISCKSEISESIEDVFPPEVASVSPSDQTANLDPGFSIAISFIEGIEPSSVFVNTNHTSCSGTVQISDDSFASCWAISSAVEFSDENRTVLITPPEKAYDKSYEFSVKATSAVKDMAGNSMQSDLIYSASISTKDLIGSISPQDGTTDVTPGTPIVINFNAQVDTSTLTVNKADTNCSGSLQISLDDFQTCEQVSDDPAFSNGNTTATIYTSSVFYGSTYKVLLTSDINDPSGTSRDSNYQTSTGFSTKNLIQEISPANGETVESPYNSIIITFTEEMDTDSITVNSSDTTCSGSIHISDDNFSSCIRLSGEPTVSNNIKTFTLTPFVGYIDSTTYKIRITNDIRDSGQVRQKENSVSKFTVAFPYTIDSSTNLMWEDDGSSTRKSHGDMGTHCDDLELAGYKNWQVPSPGELTNLFDNREILKDYQSSNYWTNKGGTYGFYTVIDFSTGESDSVYVDGMKYNPYAYIRCVRDPTYDS